MAEPESQHSLRSLLCTEERDFLIKSNGDRVKVEDLEGKIVGLYFSALSSPLCRAFTPTLSEVYTELLENGGFEIIFVSKDKHEKLFEEYHKTMPWLALPFSDTKVKEKLNQLFDVEGIPTLILLDQECKTISASGVGIIGEYGAEAYPFSKERIGELKAEEELIRLSQSLNSLLVSPDRDFVIANGGRNVPVSELVGKTVCLYFSAHWCPPCKGFTPRLIKFYNDLKSKGEDLEIVFISSDRDGESFQQYFGSMPWLALPYRDRVGKTLTRYFEIEGIPTLIVLGPDGKTLQTEAVEMVMEHGVQVYPFTKEKLDEIKAQEEARRAAQTLESLIVSDERNFVIAHSGEKVPVSELTGKTVGLYFSAHWCAPCRGFTPKLAEVYNKLKEKGEAFEIVFLSSDKDQESFDEYYASMPWLALPFEDKVKNDLSRYFHVRGIPSLVIIGPDGKTLQTEAVKMVLEHGVQVYPFTKEKMDEIKAQEEARRAAQTLESLIVSDERNFVITHSGEKVPVSEVTGKTVGLYFSAHWCPPCRGFTPKLAEVYNKLKEKGEAFEIVFLSSDKDQESFDEYYASMPWLALPFGDKVKNDLSRYFHVRGIPSLVIIGPDGKTVTTDARNIVSVHGAKAYPFTNSRLAELQKEIEEEAKKWPKEVKHSLHQHSLSLTQRQAYNCDGCDEGGSGWSFYCEECDFDLHPDCALKDEDPDKNEKQLPESEPFENGNKPAGVICEGDVCRKV